ncbi:MAG: hypothetical protein D3907_09765 [Candidatus Electrothrix sp. AUS3]|nr:hypothetical protein [Candidatus Electrothrix gigas]
MLLNAQAGGRFRVGRKRNFKGAFLGFHLNFETGPECIFISPRYGALGGAFWKEGNCYKKTPRFRCRPPVAFGVALLLITESVLSR